MKIIISGLMYVTGDSLCQQCYCHQFVAVNEEDSLYSGKSHIRCLSLCACYVDCANSSLPACLPACLFFPFWVVFVHLCFYFDIKNQIPLHLSPRHLSVTEQKLEIQLRVKIDSLYLTTPKHSGGED